MKGWSLSWTQLLKYKILGLWQKITWKHQPDVDVAVRNANQPLGIKKEGQENKEYFMSLSKQMADIYLEWHKITSPLLQEDNLSISIEWKDSEEGKNNQEYVLLKKHFNFFRLENKRTIKRYDKTICRMEGEKGWTVVASSPSLAL